MFCFVFVFFKFLLLKPAAPNKHRASHTAQLSNQTGDYLGQGPSWPNYSQLASTVSLGAHRPLCACHFILISPSDFKHPCPSWCCSILPVWQERELLIWLSSTDLAAGAGRHWARDCSSPGPCSGPRDPLSQSNLLTNCSSMSSTILASSLHICWDTAGCSLCSLSYTVSK